jgi:putative membrane protein
MLHRQKRSLLAWIPVIAATSVIAACSTGGERARQPASTRYPARPAAPSGTALSAATYFTQASALDLFEIRAADIALRRSSGRARSFALRSKQHHQAIASQLSLAGRRLNMLPSRVLPPEYQRMQSELLSTANFDRVYLAQQRQVLGRGLRLHSGYARQGRSPTLRPVAKFGATTISNELQQLGR